MHAFIQNIFSEMLSLEGNQSSRINTFGLMDSKTGNQTSVSLEFHSGIFKYQQRF